MLVYEKIFSELNKHKVDYVVVGGVALVLHGAIRLTADLDLVIHLNERNIKKFIQVMNGLGYKPGVPVGRDELMDEKKRANWIKERNMVVFSFVNNKSPLASVDIMITEPIDYAEIKEKSVQFKSGNVKIPVASIKHLIELKRMAPRAQDLADIEALKEIAKREKR